VTSDEVAAWRTKSLASIDGQLGNLQRLWSQLPDDANKEGGSLATRIRDIESERAKILAATDTSIAADIFSERLLVELTNRQKLESQQRDAAKMREAADAAQREEADAEQAHQLAIQQARAIRQTQLQGLQAPSGYNGPPGVIGVIVLIVGGVLFVIFVMILADDTSKPRWYLETRPDGVKVWVRENPTWFWFVWFR
jgi:hypothetical protein